MPLGLPDVKKVWRYVHSFRHNTVLDTYGQTDSININININICIAQTPTVRPRAHYIVIMVKQYPALRAMHADAR